jgi:hypothetical protein
MMLDLRGFELGEEAGGQGGQAGRQGGEVGANAASSAHHPAHDPAREALDVLAQAFGVVTERGGPGSWSHAPPGHGNAVRHPRQHIRFESAKRIAR